MPVKCPNCNHEFVQTRNRNNTVRGEMRKMVGLVELKFLYATFSQKTPQQIWNAIDDMKRTYGWFSVGKGLYNTGKKVKENATD